MFDQSDLKPKGLDANLRRHQSQCSVCAHPQCSVIEEEWLNWANTTTLAKDYQVSRDAVYRHMRCFRLFDERQKRWKFALERIIERLDITQFNGSNVLAALSLYKDVCEREESRQAASLPAEEVVDPAPEKGAEVPVEDRSPLEEPTPRQTPVAETVPAAEGNAEGAQAVTLLPGPEVQNAEPAVTPTVQ